MSIAKHETCNPKNAYISMFTDNIDEKIEKIIDAVDVPNHTLFQIIEKKKDIGTTVDMDLVQIIIQGELDRHFKSPICKKCLSKLHKKYSNAKESATTIGVLKINCPYFVCPNCKSIHTPYEDTLNLRDGKYQHDVQKIAALFGAKETYEEAADMMNKIYRFGISPDAVHKLTNQVASEVKLTEIIPTSDEISKIIDRIGEGRHRRPVLMFAADGAMVPIRTEKKYSSLLA